MNLSDIVGSPQGHVHPPSRTTSSYPRKRALGACHVCRARRTRCDNKRPKCGFCEATGAECIRDSSSPAQLDSASLKILDRLDDLEHQLQAVSAKLTSNTESSFPQDNISEQSLLPSHIDAVCEWPTLAALISPLHSSTLESCQSPVESDSSALTVLTSDLETALSDDALTKFFAHVHIKNPILVEDEIRQKTRRVRSNGIGWDIDSCLVLLVCANGSLATSLTAPSLSMEEIRRSEAMALFKAGQRRLGSVIGEAGITQARCLFYAGVFLMSILRPYDAWRMFLQALASCQTLDSLRSTDPKSSESWAEQSIYWSCWKSEREVRWELGLPDFGSARLGHPQLFPSVPDCDEPPRAWYFYLAEISLWRLETAARRDFTELIKDPRNVLLRATDLVPGLQDQALRWKASLPAALTPAENETDVLCYVLEGRLTYFQELLFWPFVFAAINGQTTDTTVLRYAADGLYAHLCRLQINERGFQHRHHGTWLMLRSSARSALLLVVAAHRVPSILPSDWATNVQRTIDMLQLWAAELAVLHEIVGLLQRLLYTVDQPQAYLPSGGREHR